MQLVDVLGARASSNTIALVLISALFFCFFIVLFFCFLLSLVQLQEGEFILSHYTYSITWTQSYHSLREALESSRCDARTITRMSDDCKWAQLAPMYTMCSCSLAANESCWYVLLCPPPISVGGVTRERSAGSPLKNGDKVSSGCHCSLKHVNVPADKRGTGQCGCQTQSVLSRMCVQSLQFQRHRYERNTKMRSANWFQPFGMKPHQSPLSVGEEAEPRSRPGWGKNTKLLKMSKLDNCRGAMKSWQVMNIFTAIEDGCEEFSLPLTVFDKSLAKHFTLLCSTAHKRSPVTLQVCFEQCPLPKCFPQDFFYYYYYSYGHFKLSEVFFFYSIKCIWSYKAIIVVNVLSLHCIYLFTNVMVTLHLVICFAGYCWSLLLRKLLLAILFNVAQNHFNGIYWTCPYCWFVKLLHS